MVKLHLPFYGIELRTEDNRGQPDEGVPMKRFVNVYHTKLKLKMFDFELDERDNTFQSKATSSISQKISDKFDEFKNSNINYGNIGSGKAYEYEGTEHIFIKDFFEYLKLENRQLTINQLINQ